MKKCRVKNDGDWTEGGRTGIVLGKNVFANGEYWTPVLMDDDANPDFIKTEALEFFNQKKNNSPTERRARS